LLSVVELVFDK